MKISICSLCLKSSDSLVPFPTPDNKNYEVCEKCYKKLNKPNVSFEIKPSSITVESIKIKQPKKEKVVCEHCGKKYVPKPEASEQQ
jgi:hypothetical protein